MKRIWRVQIIVGVVIIYTSMAFAENAGDWTQFRGPGGQGKAEDAKGLPAEWDSKKNIVWKRELPGPGTSSPIIIDKKIFVTCYSGYGESIDDPGEMADLERHLVCVDRATGKIVWQKDFKAELPESKYSGANNTRHGYASATPVYDGDRLYLFFGISGVYAFDLDGQELWHTKVGSTTHNWGCATSLLVHEGKLIVNASTESKALIALDCKTGKEAWKVDGVSKCWASPMLVDAPGRKELVMAIPNGGKERTAKIKAFDPKTGKELWYCDGPPDSYLCSSVVSHDDVIYAIGARKNTTIAVRAGGKGNVTDSHILWTAKKGSNVTSPVYLDGYLYFFHEKGKAVCLDAKTGETVFEESLEPSSGLVYASPLYADGKFYVSSQDNGTYVIEAKPKFKQLAVNVFKDDPSRVNACIAVSKNQLIMRTDQALYCIGQ
jgi:outer membrane protein assembly factor BamB